MEKRENTQIEKNPKQNRLQISASLSLTMDAVITQLQIQFRDYTISLYQQVS
ncbi:hypothetical protein AXX17_AT4G06030 [Arabidopsis thaliana]|uniref:Uncharacterized protein n=1 Tax=Arabidopsis thaliana TaxID=3702 RepID=A0A178V3R0_ARATH|nr:hypothetical protein AXX17_AT4G06030 [Arabidopsis thaliana]